VDVSARLRQGNLLPIVGIGVVSGLFAAMFGIGGGVVIVPLLMLVAKMPPRMAAATSLAALILTSLIGVVRYAGTDHVDWLGAALIGVPAVVGVLIGIRIQRRLPADWLVLGFGVFVIAIGLRLVIWG
jgi:uncharacterized membrane protein YfcA